ncbi:MAG TPA: redoxin domain-containing protein [Chthoniobacteraceae bacterium]|nr:redoxin domain-containing protein [Chthoniobacteraceae bacterium]
MIHQRYLTTLAAPLLLCVSTSAQEVPNSTPPPSIDRAAEGFIEKRFRRFDTNADGKLTTDEAKPVEFFVNGADENKDGIYTLEEVQAHLRKQSGTLRQQASQAPPARALAGLGGPELEQRFKQLDKNGDGKLLGEELSQARWLSRLDTNGDGVTLEEATGFFSRLVQQEPPPKDGEVLPPYVPEESSPRQGPRRIKPADAGIGRMIPDVELKDLNGKTYRLRDFTQGKATVIALVSSSCPVSKRYLPTLGSLEPEAKKAGVGVILIAPTASESAEELRKALAGAKLTAPCIPDPHGVLCQLLGATASTDVFVLDGKRTVAYHGALDDQYGLGYSLDAPRNRYAVDAVKAVMEARTPAIQATEAPGCVLDFDKTKIADSRSAITYHNRISRILQANCVECHRDDGVAPFPLENYEQVNGKSGMIRRMVERGLMPPWFAKSPVAGTHTPWMNDRSLAETDRVDLLAWLGNGKPLGNVEDAPLPKVWPGEWQIGSPDAVFQIPQPIDVKATGTMPYQNVTVNTDLTEDKWVTAFEVQPTEKEVVHHVLIFVRDASGRSQNDAAPRIRSDDDETGGFFAAYVPGNSYVIYPDGFAKPLPAGARLRFQIHYTPNGTATKDQVRIGVKFAPKEPRHIVQVAGIANVRLNIPPGASNHPESGSIPVPREVKVIGFMPHMHVRGKSFRYDVILPDGSARTLLEVPRYDFNWQFAYRYSEPVTIPSGSKIRATGWFDNSSNNPANPDPAKAVRWGPQTTDEMMLGYVEYYLPTKDPKVASE